MKAWHLLIVLATVFLGESIFVLVFLDVAVHAAPCLAEPLSPTPRSYGFDWLKPNTASCAPVQNEQFKSLRSCSKRANGTFGLKDPALACRSGARGEILIYADRATCERNLEVMKSNGP